MTNFTRETIKEMVKTIKGTIVFENKFTVDVMTTNGDMITFKFDKQGNLKNINN